MTRQVPVPETVGLLIDTLAKAGVSPEPLIEQALHRTLARAVQRLQQVSKKRQPPAWKVRAGLVEPEIQVEPDPVPEPPTSHVGSADHLYQDGELLYRIDTVCAKLTIDPEDLLADLEEEDYSVIDGERFVGEYGLHVAVSIAKSQDIPVTNLINWVKTLKS